MNQKVVKTRELILCALFSALIAVGAFLRVPIPVCPFTLQFLFTNMAGLMLGKKLGSVAVCVYIAVGLLGIPVFMGGGGIGYIFQPTFGYMIGFALGAWMAGVIVERSIQKDLKAYILAGIVDLAVVYLLGMLYYYLIANYYINSPIGVGTLILYCFVLAVPGDIFLCFLSAVLAKRLKPLIKRGVSTI